MKPFVGSAGRRWSALLPGSRSVRSDYSDDIPRVVLLAGAVFVATLASMALGYMATREWMRGTAVLIERRTAEALALLSGAIGKDMKGAWTALIVPVDFRFLEDDPPYALRQPVARAFARFPYPESFLVWRTDGTGDVLYAFNRTDRTPPWSQAAASREPYPVLLERDPPALRPLIAELRSRPVSAGPFVHMDVNVGAVPYQVVAHLLYRDSSPHELLGIVAFTVNMAWVRHEYFAPILRQLAQIGGTEQSLIFSVSDPSGQLIASSAPTAEAATSEMRRRFPMLFLDPSIVPFLPGQSTVPQDWTITVAPSRESAMMLASASARRTIIMLGIAGVATLIALVLTIRAFRSGVVLAAMKSEFVATVTHELKTPLAAIRLVGDTLAKERYTSPDSVREYARLLSNEASRLTKTIDDLLLFARHTSSPHARSAAERTNVSDLVHAALEQFRPMLDQLQFELVVDVPDNLPPVIADRAATVHVMQNLVDNAIKYSIERRSLHIEARATGRHIVVAFADQGVGIDPADLPHVFERFYRGRNNTAPGSGLGLAIADRVISSDGGRIDITSAPDRGTRVQLTLKADRTL